LITNSLWTRRFGGTPDVLGRAVELDNQPYTIVGVLPSGFELFQPAEIYLPLGPWAATLPDDRGWHPGILPVARLRDDVSLSQAQAETTTLSAQLETEYPQFNGGVRAKVTELQTLLVQNVRPALLMLLGAVSFGWADRARTSRIYCGTPSAVRRRLRCARSRQPLPNRLSALVESVVLAAPRCARRIVGVSLLMTTVTGRAPLVSASTFRCCLRR
jgi:putative ABC transport system permease protein